MTQKQQAENDAGWLHRLHLLGNRRTVRRDGTAIAWIQAEIARMQDQEA